MLYFMLQVEGTRVKYNLHDVLYVPSANLNVISVARLLEKGIALQMKADKLLINDPRMGETFKAEKRRDLFFLNAEMDDSRNDGVRVCNPSRSLHSCSVGDETGEQMGELSRQRVINQPRRVDAQSEITNSKRGGGGTEEAGGSYFIRRGRFH